MGTPSQAIPRAPDYRLFDAGAVATAAFVCCPFAGAVLIAVNYVRLGKAGKAILAVILGLVVTTLNVAIRWSWRTPSGSVERLKYDMLQLLVVTATWFCAWKIAKEEQGEAVANHVARGGQLGSRVTAFFVGIATWAGLVIVAVVVFYAYQIAK